MDLLDLLMPRMAADDSWTPANPPVGMFSSARTRAGVTVTEEIALTYQAVFAATRCLAEGIGSVPLPCYERVDENDRRQASTPAADAIRYQANSLVSASVFREGRVAHQVNWGGGFAEIDRDSRTGEVRLWPIHPCRVMPYRLLPRDAKRDKSDDYDYTVLNSDGTRTDLYADELLHIPGCLSDDGLWGRGVVRHNKQTIGLGIATERHAEDFFGAGGPSGIISAEKFGGSDAASKERRREFRAEWEAFHSRADNKGPRIALFGKETTYTPLGLTNEANQLIETRAINSSHVAAIYLIPGYKIGTDAKETAGTIEQKAIEFVVYSLLPWARKIEEQCNLKLLSAQERKTLYFEHNFSALLRGDIMARYNAYRIAFSIGMMCINEIRRLENLPGIGPRGDEYLVPANMVTLDRMISGDVGTGRGLGSDTTGSPADNPLDRQAAMDRQHHDMMSLLGKIDRAEAKNQLADLEKALEPRKAEWREGARKTLVDALSRMFTKESRAAMGVQKPKLATWLSEFYAKHEPLMAEALGPACFVMGIAGVKQWSEPRTLASWLRARSTEAIERTFNNDSPEVRQRKLEAWASERANDIAEEILQ